jgi:hypothetical protein
MKPIRAIRDYIQEPVSAAPLAVFRITFGLLMLISIIRFAAHGWIDQLYIQPSFHFSYLGFEWVKPLDEWTYLIFFICGLSALFVAIGFRYTISIVVFFLSFTYIELMDKTTYLNHYYFISILSFLMIWLPANATFSVDAVRSSNQETQIPRWCIDAVKLLVGIVYFYAGLAKLNSDWLFHAMPLQIWLPAKYSLPFLGDLLQHEWMHYLFAWGGALYDLTIPFLLLYKPTRVFAFILVIIFHALTRVLFPIGMFPFIMIAAALIFFDADFHQRILQNLSKLRWFRDQSQSISEATSTKKLRFSKVRMTVVGVFFALQLLLPFRYTLYPGELFWTEEGYRFSWRVMLIEKAGIATFWVQDDDTNRRFQVDNSQHLTRFQEKQMATQPDFILEFAHYLDQYYQQQGIADPKIYVESFVALNGRQSQPFIDPTVDLSNQPINLKPKTWILPFNDVIKGL